MRRALSLGMVLIIVLGMSPQVGSAASSTLIGRLGGDQKGFEAKYGMDRGKSAEAEGLSYDIDGYGEVAARYRSGILVAVTVIADRLSHQPLNEADSADWDAKSVDAVALAFLPKDAKTNKKRLDTGDGRREVACSSKLLAEAFDKTTWKKLKLGGDPGECHYLISPDSTGNAYQVEISLGRAGSLDRPTPTPSPTPTPTSEEMKAAYAPLEDIRELAIRPGGMMGKKIVFGGPISVIQVAPAGYGYDMGDNTHLFCKNSIQVRVSAVDGSTYNVAVCFQGDTTGMFKGTWVTVYGIVAGTDSGTNAFGGLVIEPFVSAQFVEIG